MNNSFKQPTTGGENNMRQHTKPSCKSRSHAFRFPQGFSRIFSRSWNGTQKYNRHSDDFDLGDSSMIAAGDERGEGGGRRSSTKSKVEMFDLPTLSTTSTISPHRCRSGFDAPAASRVHPSPKQLRTNNGSSSSSSKSTAAAAVYQTVNEVNYVRFTATAAAAAAANATSGQDGEQLLRCYPDVSKVTSLRTNDVMTCNSLPRRQGDAAGDKVHRQQQEEMSMRGGGGVGEIRRGRRERPSRRKNKNGGGGGVLDFMVLDPRSLNNPMRGSHWSVASDNKVTLSSPAAATSNFSSRKNPSLLRGAAASNSSIDLEWETAEDALVPSFAQQELLENPCNNAAASLQVFEVSEDDEDDDDDDNDERPEESLTLSRIPTDVMQQRDQGGIPPGQQQQQLLLSSMPIHMRHGKRHSNASKGSSQTSLPGLDWDDQADDADLVSLSDNVGVGMPMDIETEQLICEIEQLTSRALEETQQWKSLESTTTAAAAAAANNETASSSSSNCSPCSNASSSKQIMVVDHQLTTTKTTNASSSKQFAVDCQLTTTKAPNFNNGFESVGEFATNDNARSPSTIMTSQQQNTPSTMTSLQQNDEEEATTKKSQTNSPKSLNNNLDGTAAAAAENALGSFNRATMA